MKTIGTRPIFALPSGTNSEETPVRINITMTEPCEMTFLQRFSSLTRLLRITARLFRMTTHYRKGISDSNETPDYVTVLEWQQAKLAWVKYIQSLYFAKDISMRSNLINA